MSQYLIDIDEKVMDVAFKPEIVRDRYVKAGLTSKSCLPSLDAVLKTCLRELSDDERMPIDENFILFLQKKKQRLTWRNHGSMRLHLLKTVTTMGNLPLGRTRVMYRGKEILS